MVLRASEEGPRPGATQLAMRQATPTTPLHLRRNERMLRQVVDDGLVLPAVAERQLVRVAACCHTEQLVA